MTVLADSLLRWSVRESTRRMRSLGRRREHVRRVALLAGEVGRAFGEERCTLVAAAYLHDVGYAPELADTGFHPLDGARMVREAGHERVARLVAHHSGARFEAELRGIEGFLDEFPFEESELDFALTYCDLTTGPGGERVTLENRVEEIRHRYGPEHVVSRAMERGMPEFVRAREATEKRMADAGITLSGSLAYPGLESPLSATGWHR